MATGRCLGWCLAACFLGVASAGQSPPPVVEARMLLGSDAAHANTLVKAAVIAKIKPGYHLNDNRPALDYLIPTEVKLETPKELRIAKVIYPRGRSRRFAFSDAPLSVYEDTLGVGIIVRVGRKVSPGVYTLRGTLAYQACNDHACLPPATAPLTLAVKVVPRAVAVKTVNADDFSHIQFE